MKTVTICGSMRFTNEMKSIAYYLETQQKFNVLQCVYLPDKVVPTDEDIKVLEVTHYRKIDLSDGIYDVNIDGHIGNSVRREIEYAKKHNKEVIYHI